MAAEPQIRPAAPEQADEIAAVMRAGFAPEITGLTIYGCPGSAEFIRRQITTPAGLGDTIYTVAVMAGRVVGAVEMRRLPQALFLNFISVLPEAQAHGLGRPLLAQSIRQTGATDRPEMLLDVFVHNDIARTWYERLGFVAQYDADWWEVTLPDGGEPLPCAFSGLPQALVCHEAFGFSQVRLSTAAGGYDIGCLGEDWFRVTQVEPLLDPAVAPALRAFAPQRRLFAIIRQGQLPAALQPRARHILGSRRMSAPLPPLLERLG